MHITPTSETESLCFVTYAHTTVLSDCKCEIMACKAIAYSYKLFSRMWFNSMAMPTTDTTIINKPITWRLYHTRA